MPEAAGAGFNPQSPPGFPLLPITFSHPILHNPPGSLSQPGGDRGGLCVPLSRDSDAIAALGITSLSHISPLPLAAGWSLSQPGVPQAGLLPG